MENYYAKYLKYKNKYLYLKQLTGGGLCSSSLMISKNQSAECTSEYMKTLDGIITKILANSLTPIAKGGTGTVYMDTIEGVQYVVKKVMIANGDKEVARYKQFSSKINTCKSLDMLADKNIDKDKYILYLFGGESYTKWLSKNVGVDVIPILLQIVEQMKCLDTNNTIHLDIKSDNVVIAKFNTGECKDCFTVCGGYEVKPGENYLARLIDLTSLYDKTKISGALPLEEQALLLTLFTEYVNDLPDSKIRRFAADTNIKLSSVILSGFANLFTVSVLNNSPDTVNLNTNITDFGLKIINKLSEEFPGTYKKLGSIGYPQEMKCKAVFTFITLCLWSSPGSVKLELLNGVALKDKLTLPDLTKNINDILPIFRFLFATFLKTTYPSVVNSDAKACHIVHILGRCCHFDPSQRYNYGELAEELYRFGTSYTGFKVKCTGVVSDKLFDATKNTYLVKPADLK